MKATTGTHKPELTPMLDGKQIMQFQQVVRQVVVADHVFAYVADLVRSDAAEGDRTCRSGCRNWWRGAPGRGPAST